MAMLKIISFKFWMSMVHMNFSLASYFDVSCISYLLLRSYARPSHDNLDARLLYW